jgi:hypothetical protein
MKSLCLAATALCLSLAGQAHALVAFSIGSVNGVDPGYAAGEIPVVTFDAANAAGVVETNNTGPMGLTVTNAATQVTDVSQVGLVGLFDATHVNVAAAPVGDTSMYEAIQPGGWAKFDFTNYTPGVGSLSVYVGSIDSYNLFQITTSDGTYFFDGTDFLYHDGDQYSHLTNRRVYFQFSPNETFKSITFASNGIAFEYDNIGAAAYSGMQPAGLPTGNDVESLHWTSFSPAAAPEPGTWALMIAGFGLVGVGSRRRRSALAV